MRRVIYKMLAMAMCFSILLVGCQQPVELPNPEAAGNITDIRMTVGEEEISGDTTLLRVYYGYFADGQWYDYPSEYYTLKSVFPVEFDDGFMNAYSSHIVKIGPYLLACIIVDPVADEKTPCPVRVVDSLENEYPQAFAEYYSHPGLDAPKYGLVWKNPRPDDSKNSTKVEWNEMKCGFFSRYYFAVLEYDTLPEDYVLSYLTIDNDKLITQTLTYAEIKQLIEG